MKNTTKYAQLYFRLALGLGFLIPVADRIGWLGPAGQNGVSWGNWINFVTYAHMLMPYISRHGSSFMGLLASIGEVYIGCAFLTGYKTRLAAIGGFLLTLTFALSMAIFMGFKAPFFYSVYADSAGCLLLSTVPVFCWSLDNYFMNAKK
jgi:uncharacterized membrane protein YphA (DoxX/SURF4 family)